MKPFHSCFSACALVATTIAVAGCSSSAQKPSSEQYDDVAQSLSTVITAQGGGELGSFSATASLATGSTPANVSVNAQGTFESSSAGVTYQFTLACEDAQGHALAACGATTSSAEAGVTWGGRLSVPDLTASVQRSGTLALTGLQTSTVTLQGTGSFTFDAQLQSLFRSAQANAQLSFDSSYDAVTWDTSAKHVTGGAVHYTVSASETSSSTSGSTASSFAVDADVTFAADGSATIVLDGNVKYLLSAGGFLVKV